MTNLFQEVQIPNFDIQNTKIDPNLIKDIKNEKGTTTLSFIFKHGMIIAVDSRATAGSYIASQSVQKVIEINKFLLGTMAGGAADCFYWEKLMGIQAKRYELREGRRISASAASKYLSNCVYQYKGYGLSMGTMICGYDTVTDEKGVVKSQPAIFYVDNDGKRVKGDLFSVGSGSTIAYGVLQDYRFDMEKEEAIDLGKRAIFHAAHRDAFSGGIVRVYFMDQNGWEKIGDYNVKDIYDEMIKE